MGGSVEAIKEDFLEVMSEQSLKGWGEREVGRGQSRPETQEEFSTLLDYTKTFPNQMFLRTGNEKKTV